MNKKKWNRTAAVTLVAVLAFANSMTVFAYRDTFEREVAEDVSAEEIEEMLEEDTVVFVPEGMDTEARQELYQPNTRESVTEILYESQFTDEEGNVYPVAEDEGIEPHCNHTFVSGTLATHRKTDDGGCVVKEYKAQRCSKCGYVIQGETISTTTFTTCPH